MVKEIFTKSENFRQEYSATIVRVGELKDIENSDNLKQVIIDGFSVVVNKNDVKEGDLMIYCKNETELNKDFLSINNMFEIGERDLNKNYKEVENLIIEGKQDEAKKLVGYFNKHGRVKMIRLRGCPSMGVLLRFDSFIKFDNKLKNVNLEDYITYDDNGNFIPFDFDTINGRLFIKAYVPKITGCGSGDGKKRGRKTKQFDRMIPGEWNFHYDTQQLNSNMWRFHPEDVVCITTKIHGTSLVLGNCLIKNPIHLDSAQKWFNKKCRKRIKKIGKALRYDNNFSDRLVHEQKCLKNKIIKNYNVKYADIYSSRTVIKNQFINPAGGQGFYESDVWGEYHNLFKGLIPHGMTIYGEIFGYLTGSNSMIQSTPGPYDYGCEPGENKLMIYRISQKTENGIKEYSMKQVIKYSEDLIKKYPEIGKFIMVPEVLYYGKMMDLYPDLDIANHWNENVLEKMKKDERFGMEKDEYLCNHKVPREGICIRIEDDPIAECFKLKTLAFLGKEAECIDKGKVDVEMIDNYLNS